MAAACSGKWRPAVSRSPATTDWPPTAVRRLRLPMVSAARALGGPLGVQGLLVQDACVQGADRGPGVDAEILGEGRFQSPIGLQSVGLAFSDVVGGDQLRPQRFAVGVFAGKRLELTDDGIRASARDFGFRAGGVGQQFVFCQRGGECLDEGEVAQVIKNRPAPFGQCGREVATGLFESARGGSADTRGLFDGETAQIAVGVSDGESIPRRCAG